MIKIPTFIRNLFLYGIFSVIGRLAGFLLVPIYTRCFSTRQYGAIDLISVSITFIAIFSALQLESAIARFFYEAKEKQELEKYISTVFWTILILSSLCSIITTLLSQPLSKALFKSNEYQNVISIAALGIPLINLFGFFSIIVRFLNKTIIFGIITTTQLLVSIFGAIWLVVYLKIGVIGVFISQNIGLLSAVLLFSLLLKKYIKFEWDRHLLKEFLKYSIPIIPAVGGNWINSYANRFVMLGYLSISEIGLYSVALKVSTIFSIVQSAFRMVWVPSFWEIFQKKDHRDVYKRIFVIAVLAIFPIVIILAIFSKEILHLLVSSSFYKSAQLLPLLFLSIGITILTDIVGVGPDIKKTMIYNTLIYYSGVAVNFAFLFILVPHFGLIAVPICLLCSTMTIFILFWITTEKMYYIGYSKIAFVISFILALIGVITSMIVDFNLFVKIVLALFIIIGVAVYMHKKGFFSNRLRLP